MTATFHPGRDLVRVPISSRAPRTVHAPADDAGPVPAPNYLLRRIVAVIVGLSVLAAASVAVGGIVGAVSDLGGRPAAASEITGARTVPAVHVAAPGDTLWSIADLYRGDIGHARYVDALVDLNGGAGIQAGQAVRLP